MDLSFGFLHSQKAQSRGLMPLMNLVDIYDASILKNLCLYLFHDIEISLHAILRCPFKDNSHQNAEALAF